jgi:hypothetical protein
MPNAMKGNIMATAKTALTFAEIEKMNPSDLFGQGSTIPKLNTAIASARDKFKNSLHFGAKVVAALKRLYIARLNAKQIPQDVPFSSKKAGKGGFFEQNCGGLLPGRVEALAALFNSLVLTFDVNGKPLLTEKNFDAAKVDWLEKANAIVSHAQEKLGENWKGCDDVLDTLNALSNPGDPAKTLKEIRKRQKGETAVEGGDAPVLTIGMAVEYLKAAVKSASQMPAEIAANLFKSTVEISDEWANSGIPTDTLNQWSDNINNGIAPELEIVREPVAA